MNLPALHGNWIDLIILVVLLLYVFERWGKGFVEGMVDVGGFLLSLLFALKFYSVAAQILILNFSLTRGIANALGFLMVAFLGELLLYFVLGVVLQFINQRILKSKLNRYAGFFPSILSGLILVAFLLTLFLTLPVRPDVKNAILNSKIGGYLAQQTQGVERAFSQVFGGAVQETLTFLTIKPTSRETVDLNFETTEFTGDENAEKEMLILVNQERQNNGLSLLSENEPLRSVARAHCEDMFKRGYFSHYTPEKLSPFDRMNAAGIRYRAAGENLAYAPNVEIAHNGLMNSPGHRANILSVDFGKVGIGIINGGIYGRMFCQEFTD